MNLVPNQQVDMQYAEPAAAANSKKQDGVGTDASRADTTGGTEGGTAFDRAGDTGDTVLTVKMLKNLESKIQVITISEANCPLLWSPVSPPHSCPLSLLGLRTW